VQENLARGAGRPGDPFQGHWWHFLNGTPAAETESRYIVMLDKELELVDIALVTKSVRIQFDFLTINLSRLRIWGEYECSLLQLSLNICNLYISTWIRSGYLSVVPMKFRNIFVRRLEMIHKVEDSNRKSIRVL
jgi:hypothetical protein